jgi:hypothetical protein
MEFTVLLSEAPLNLLFACCCTKFTEIITAEFQIVVDNLIGPELFYEAVKS